MRGADPTVLRDGVYALTHAVRKALRGEAPVLAGGGILDRPAILRHLRSEVLESWPGNDGELLPLMRAFEVVEEGLLAADSDGPPPGATVAPFSRNLLREVAHLLRSPLGSIAMLTATLLEERSGPLTEVQRKELGIIHRAAVTVTSAAGDLLTLWSEEDRAGRIVEFSVNDTIDRVANAVRPVSTARHSSLVVEHSVRGPRAGPALAITEALFGLALRGALRTRGGSVELRAREDADDAEIVIFSVSTGRGEAGAGGSDPAALRDPARSQKRYPDDPLFRIFLPEADSGGFTLSAAGLDLSAAREIIRRLGSDLRLEAPGKEELRMSFPLRLPDSRSVGA